MTAGIPDGWNEEERADLRTGGWRFYRAVDPSFSESVSEQNIVVRDGERVSGPEAIHALLSDAGAFADPPVGDPVAAARLAEQVGHFVVEPTSRSSGRVRLRADHPPTLREDGGALVLQATYDRDGAPWPVTVVARASGEVSVDAGGP
jgi:hypothetical protein